MPIVRISKALKGKPPGTRLIVVASDPAFRADLDAWAEARGEKVVAFEDTGLQQRAVIEKASQ